MVKVTITNDSTIYDDDTVRQTTEWKCQTPEDFERLWEDKKIGTAAVSSSRDIKWRGDISTLTITATEYVHYTEVLYSKEHWVLSEDETRMLKIGQIESWMAVNPQHHEEEVWDAVVMMYENLKKSETWEQFDMILRGFTTLTRTMYPACFHRGDEEE